MWCWKLNSHIWFLCWINLSFNLDLSLFIYFFVFSVKMTNDSRMCDRVDIAFSALLRHCFCVAWLANILWHRFKMANAFIRRRFLVLVIRYYVVSSLGNSSELFDLSALTNSTDLVCSALVFSNNESEFTASKAVFFFFSFFSSGIFLGGLKLITVLFFLFLPFFIPAGKCYLGISDQEAVYEVWRTVSWRKLWLHTWHHPDVFHFVPWDLHLLHVSEEVQDEPLLPHPSEWQSHRFSTSRWVVASVVVHIFPDFPIT